MKSVTSALVATVVVLCLLAITGDALPLRRRGHTINWDKVDTKLMDAKFGRGSVKRDAPTNSSLFEVIPGRYPKTVSLPDVLAQVPNTAEGRQFIQDMANSIFAKFGIWVPNWVIDYFFVDSSYFLDYLVLTGAELADGTIALNLAYQMGWLQSNNTPAHVLPQGFDVGNYANAPINATSFLPPLPVQLFPGLWQGFYRGNASEDQLKAEIVFSLALNQLANNSHKVANDPTTYYVVYDNQKFTSVRDLLQALSYNGHSISCYLTYRAVDFFGYLTRDDQGNFKEVPFPVFLNTGITSLSGEAAVTTAIHDEIKIEIRAGPNTKGIPINIDLLWYEGDDGIGFFAGSLYNYATWVGQVNTQFMEGSQAIEYIHLASVFSDVLINTALQFNLYDLGYGATGVCVDSIAVIEWTVYGNMSLYPLLMEKPLVAVIVAQDLALGNANFPEYTKLAEGLYELVMDTSVNPTTRVRALNTVTWPAGEEPFETVVRARSILGSPTL